MPCFPSSYDELLRVNKPLSQYYIHRQAVKHNTAYGTSQSLPGFLKYFVYLKGRLNMSSRDSSWHHHKPRDEPDYYEYKGSGASDKCHPLPAYAEMPAGRGCYGGGIFFYSLV